jgi:hypothetical protein
MSDPRKDRQREGFGIPIDRYRETPMLSDGFWRRAKSPTIKSTTIFRKRGANTPNCTETSSREASFVTFCATVLCNWHRYLSERGDLYQFCALDPCASRNFFS